jgi:hypothetical protein
MSPRSLRHVLQVNDGLTAKIFAMLSALAIGAIEAGREQITDGVAVVTRCHLRGHLLVRGAAHEAFRPLPVVLRARPDELLSSWLARHATYYGVARRHLLDHVGLSAGAADSAGRFLPLRTSAGCRNVPRRRPRGFTPPSPKGFSPTTMSQLCKQRRVGRRPRRHRQELDAGLAIDVQGLRQPAR